MIASSPKATFAQILRIHREARRLTQEELAQLTGLSAAAIRDLEQGRTRRPQPRSVRALVDALGLSEAETKKFHGVIPSARRPPGRSGPGQPVAAATSQKDAAGPVMLSILGPLVVLDGTAALHIESDRARTLLGRLALTPNRTVVRDELIELLWGERVPATAVNLVQTYVSRLRRVLEPARPARGPSRALTLTPAATSSTSPKTSSTCCASAAWSTRRGSTPTHPNPRCPRSRRRSTSGTAIRWRISPTCGTTR
ncbi:helix-turn-helix domain-containing protein [Polymorphospora rubra]|uniref:helix-turn-helix domain-containing protein n=1 Tax=Polymorphospora rubra TaxID=338584 RepID=UPI001FEA8ED5|nr:helix-turn-helix domain-containing protein [Polymorphospora rubra]